MAKARVLLVEDNHINQVVARKILAKEELTADVVASGEAALERLASHPYDLVLMDVRLPGIDGMQATRAIRAGEAGITDTGVPVIALTAYASEEDREACYDAGMDGYLSKPLEINAFIETVRRHIRPSGSGKGPEEGAGEQKAPLFDQEAIGGLLGKDPDLVKVALETFLGLLDRKLRRLGEAADAENAEEARRAAHALAGAAGNVAARALEGALRDVEGSARIGELHEVREAIPELERLAQETRRQMKAFREEME